MIKKDLKTHLISFRVNAEDFMVLQNEAIKRKLPVSLAARDVLQETLSGFDEKQEVFLRRFDKLDEHIDLLQEVVSLGAAASALPLDAAQQNVGEVNKRLKAHFELSSGLGKNILELIKIGKL